MRTLCLGEALVDLVCEHPVEDLSAADEFVPHAGGAVANAAVAAGRCGAETSLAGGVGDDAWGEWLRARLDSEGVDTRWLAGVSGSATPVAFVTVDYDSQPSFAVYGESIGATIGSLSESIDAAVESCEALFFGSNTLVGEVERDVTLRARERALEAGKPVMFDPNLRLHRWLDHNHAIDLVRSCCRDALLVKVNRDEALQITGEGDAARAAEELCRLGAGTAVVTLGADGALSRGQAHASVGGFSAQVVDTTGAGDVVAGVLIAALAAASFEPQAIVGCLKAAVESASRSTEGWGAIDALPDPMPKFASLSAT